MNKSEIEFANEQSDKMSDLINKTTFKNKYLCFGYLPEMSEKEFDRFPTVDAVEVVRCKNCKKWMDFSNYKGWENRGFCFLHETNNSSDDFCSYGERKEASEDV